MIQGEHLEKAERGISNVYAIAVGATAVDRVCMKAGLDRDATDAFIQHHLTQLGKAYLPDLDPRHEPALATMFLHMLAVGATAQRASEDRL